LLVAQAASSFYSGRGNTAVVMWVDAAYAVVNLVLDYLWIFGYAGFPAMGIAGAGYATVLALSLKAITYLLLMLQATHRAEFATMSGMRLDRDLLRRLVRFGVPSGLQMLLDVVGFTVFVVLVGRLGALEAEATSMAFSVSTLAFMPIWGFGLATGILVGQRLGEGNPDLAARSTWTTLVIGMAYMSAISVMYLLVPELFLWGFFAGGTSSAEAHAPLRELSIRLLRYVAAYNLLDAMLTIFVNAIKGAGDTRFVLVVSLCMGGLLAGFSWLAVEVLDLGIYGCWMIITAWVWFCGIIYLLRFLQGKWRDMLVIEHQTDVVDPSEPHHVPAQAIEFP
jgi:MATE family multidrug resistance protein